MDPKPRTSRFQEIRLLRGLTGEQRMLRMLDLSARGQAMVKQAVRQQHPGATEPELARLVAERFSRCRNMNY